MWLSTTDARNLEHTVEMYRNDARRHAAVRTAQSDRPRVRHRVANVLRQLADRVDSRPAPPRTQAHA